MQNLSEDMIMAQGIGFFIAGFDTITTTLSTLCYNLAKHPTIQDTVFDEISCVMEKNGGKIDQESINELIYLEAVIQESLRICPPVTKYRLSNKAFPFLKHHFTQTGQRMQ